MKKFTAALWMFVWGMTVAGSVWAAEMQFEPANRSGSAPAPEYSEERKAKKEKVREPGFWDREYERSGLKGTSESLSQSTEKMGGVFSGDFFKNQSENYRARHPKTE